MKTFIVGLVFGVAAGWGLAQLWSPKPEQLPVAERVAAEKSAKPEARREMEAKRAAASVAAADGGRFSEERVAPKKSLAGLSGVEQLTELLQLAQERKFQLQISLLEGRAAEPRTCSKAFREFFDLTDAEVAEIDQAMADAHRTQQKLMAERAVVKTDAAGALRIEVPFFVEEGGQIFDEINGTMARVLGAERKRVLDQMKTRELEDIYDGLGTKAVSFDLSKSAQGFSWKRSSTGGAGGSATMSSMAMKPEAVQQQLGALYSHPAVQAWLKAQK